LRARLVKNLEVVLLEDGTHRTTWTEKR
jgi:hypothetical protein